LWTPSRTVRAVRRSSASRGMVWATWPGLLVGSEPGVGVVVAGLALGRAPLFRELGAATVIPRAAGEVVTPKDAGLPAVYSATGYFFALAGTGMSNWQVAGDKNHPASPQTAGALRLLATMAGLAGRFGGKRDTYTHPIGRASHLPAWRSPGRDTRESLPPNKTCQSCQ
jgi:hypothetical protein